MRLLDDTKEQRRCRDDERITNRTFCAQCSDVAQQRRCAHRHPVYQERTGRTLSECEGQTQQRNSLQGSRRVQQLWQERRLGEWFRVPGGGAVKGAKGGGGKEDGPRQGLRQDTFGGNCKKTVESTVTKPRRGG